MTRALAGLVAVALLASPSAPAYAQTLVIDHKKQEARLDDKGALIEDGDRIRVGKELKVRVKNSNSAVYACTVQSEDAAVPEMDALQAFLKGLGPYVPDFAVVREQQRGVESLEVTDPDALQVRRYLREVDGWLLNAAGVRPLLTRTLAQLDSLRNDNALPLTKYQADVQSGCDPAGKCTKLKATAGLAQSLALLADAVAKYRQALGDREPATAGDRAMLKAASAALADADDLMNLAYTTERLVVRTYKATTTFDCGDDVTVSFTKAKKATVTVDANALPGLKRTATIAPFEATFDVQPDWIVRPVIGLALLVSRDSRFQTFGTEELADGTFQINVADSTDNRFTYGLTLSNTWRWLDWRDTHHFAVYLPELTVNPSDDVKAFAAGLALSYRGVKIGYGKLWTKHTVLRAQNVGGILADAGELATRETYGKGRSYWSISFVGLAPFIP